MSKKTGNFFIEFLSYLNPSGIQTTHADFYIISDTNIFYMIEVEILKKLLFKLGNNKKVVHTPDESTFGYIIKKELIIDLSIIL